MNNYSVYKLTFSDNKVYIGQTSLPVEERWKNGEGYRGQDVYLPIVSDGWNNIKKEILHSNLSAEQAAIYERYYIKYYNSIKNGYNRSSGGLVNKTFTTEDYSDFIEDTIYPNRLIKIVSQVYKGKDNRPSVLYTCINCNSGIIYEGRVDNIRKGHTWRCPICGRKHAGIKPEGLDWERKACSTKENINTKNLKSNHCGETRGDWLIIEYDHGDHQGHSYYKCRNIKTNIEKVTRLDNLPHKIQKIPTNMKEI